MVRILPMASSLRPSISSFRFAAASRLAHSLTSYTPTRRLPSFHLGFAVAQAQFFGLNTSKLWQKEHNNTIRVAINGSGAQASTTTSPENILEWVKKDKRRFLHVVYRVGDLERTIKFYTECLGMKLLRKRDIPEERYTNAFLGYGPEDAHFVIELTYNYGVDKYDIGTGFGHFGIAVEDVSRTVELIKAKGGKVTREPGPVKGGSTVIAFIEDPDGYKFELLERGPTPEPLCQVMLRVGDLDRSINFYEKAFGMEVLRKRDNPDYKKILQSRMEIFCFFNSPLCRPPGPTISKMRETTFLSFHFYFVSMLPHGRDMGTQKTDLINLFRPRIISSHTHAC